MRRLVEIIRRELIQVTKQLVPPPDIGRNSTGEHPLFVGGTGAEVTVEHPQGLRGIGR